MMKNVKKLLVSLFFLVPLSVTSDAEAAALTTEFLTRQIQTQWSSAIIHVIPMTPHTVSNPNSCANSDYYAIEPGDPAYKEKVAMALAAHLGNKPVQLVIDGCSSDGRPRIISFLLKR